MKTIIAVSAMALILAGGAFATGSALDPRVPGLQRQVRALKVRVDNIQGTVNNKLDKNCIAIMPVVIRPGYVYRANDGTFIIYKAFDEYSSATDSSFSRVMVLANGC